MKKFLSILLTVLLVFSMVPMAFAEGLTSKKNTGVTSIDGEVVVYMESNRSRSRAVQLPEGVESATTLMTLSDNSKLRMSGSIKEIKLFKSNTLSTNELIKVLEGYEGVIYAEPNVIFSVNGSESQIGLEKETPIANENITTQKAITPTVLPEIPLEKQETTVDTPVVETSVDVVKKQAKTIDAVSNPMDYNDMSKFQWAYHNDGTMAGISDTDVGIKDWNTSSASELGTPVVAVLDTGIDYEHPDLKDNMWTNESNLPIGGGLYGYNAVEQNAKGDAYEETDPMDDFGHGTHCAGIIASTWNGTGTSGIAENAQVMAVKAGDDMGSFPMSDVFKGFSYIQQAKIAGVNVVAINNSWGGVYAGNILNEVIRDLGQTTGIICVFASGNESTNCDITSTTVWGLKDNPYVVTVNALDNKGKMSTFSNYGASTTDVAAPGTNILSTIPLKWAQYVARLANDNVLYEDFENSNESIFIVEEKVGSAEVIKQTANNGTKFIRDGEAGFELTTGKKDGEDVSVVRLKATQDLSAVEKKPEYLSLPIAAAEVQGSTLMDVKVSVKTTGGEFVPLSLARDETQSTKAMNVGRWTDVGFDLSKEENINWQEFEVEITARIMDQTYQTNPDNPTTYEGNIYIDAIGIGSQKVPYEDYVGTSMAAPAVSGEVAILSEKHKEDDPKKRAARIIGSVETTDQLQGTSVSGGYIRVDKTDNPVPVISSAVRAVAGENQITIEGYFFGSVAGKVTIGDTDMKVDNWTDEKITVTIPDGFVGGQKRVEVAREDKATGHQSFEIVGGDSLYENSLPLPNYNENPDFYNTSGCTLTALNGKLYYLSKIATDTYLWSYDLKTQNWQQLEVDTVDYVEVGTSSCTWNGKIVTTSSFMRDGGMKQGVSMYTPETNSWENFSDPSFEDFYGPAIANSGGNLMLVSGMNIIEFTKLLTGQEVDFENFMSEKIYQINPETKVVEQKGEMNQGVYGGSAVYAEDNSVYIFGGTVMIDQEILKNKALEKFKDGKATVVKENILPKEDAVKQAYAHGSIKNGIVIAGESSTVDGQTMDTWKLNFSDDQPFKGESKRLSGSSVIMPIGTAYNGQFYVMAESNNAENNRVFRSTNVETIKQPGEEKLIASTDTMETTSSVNTEKGTPNVNTGTLEEAIPAVFFLVLLLGALGTYGYKKKKMN